MEFYPPELLEQPIPLVAFLSGRSGKGSGSSPRPREENPKLVQTKTALVTHLDSINRLSSDLGGLPTLHFFSLPLDHAFPPRKENARLSKEKELENIVPGGILKSNWLGKHHALLPAVALAVFEFDPSMAPQDWAIQDTVISDEYDRLRRSLGSRDCRIIVMLLHHDAGGRGAGDQHLLDEKISSMRRRTEIDSKSIVYLRQSDVSASSAVLKKLENNLRALAYEYYRIQAKREKRTLPPSRLLLQLTNPSSEFAIAMNMSNAEIRYEFKTAHFYEFRRQGPKMLKHYVAAYSLTCDLLQQMGVFGGGSLQVQEVKAVADWINFKICSHQVSSLNAKEAIQQFRYHIRTFERAIGPPEVCYEHWLWMSRQFKVFAQLMENFQALAAGTAPLGQPSTGLDSTMYTQPYLYYHLAAKHAITRRKEAQRLGVSRLAFSQVTGRGDIPLSSFTVVPSPYVGGDASVTVASSVPSPTPTGSEALVQYKDSLEKTSNQSDEVIALLDRAYMQFKQALMSLDVKGAQTVENAKFASRLQLQVGEELLVSGKYAEAADKLGTVRDAFTQHKWWAIVAEILKNLIKCMEALNDGELLSPRLAPSVSLEERRSCQERFFYAIESSPGVSSPLSFALDSNRSIFSSEVRFLSSNVFATDEVAVEMTVTSHFPSEVTLSRVEVCFTDAHCNHSFTHSPDIPFSSFVESSLCSLTLPPESPVTFIFRVATKTARKVLLCESINFYMGHSRECILTIKSGKKGGLQIGRRSSVDHARGVAPALGRGAGSPSFSRRHPKLAELPVSPRTVSELADIAEDAANGSYLVILQPHANLSIQMTKMPPVLAGEFRKVHFTLESGADTVMDGAKMVLSCDPPPRSLEPKDALFWVQEGTKLSPAPYQNGEQSLPVKRMNAHSSQPFSFFFRSPEPRSRSLVVQAHYRTDKGCEVMAEYKTDISSHAAFGPSFRLSTELPQALLDDVKTPDAGETPTSLPSPSPQRVAVDQPVQVQIDVSCVTEQKIEILKLGMAEPQQESCSVIQEIGTFNSLGGEEKEKATRERTFLSKGDVHSVCLTVLPLLTGPRISFGSLVCVWRRMESADERARQSREREKEIMTELNRDALNVHTQIPLPAVGVEQPPFSLRLLSPSAASLGQSFSLSLHLTNHTPLFQSLSLSVQDSSEFLVAGTTNTVIEVFPHQSTVISFTLVPVICGHQLLPTLEVISQRYQLKLYSAAETRELFVFPGRKQPARVGG